MPSNNLIKFAKILILKMLAAFTIFCSLASLSFAEEKPSGLIDGLATPYPAPLIIGINAWINSPPVKLSDLKGKVVLIEFWTSSCPYCKSALPYVNQWYKRYHDQGLLIIGIHSPKTEDEHSLAVVKKAVTEYAIPYPVALDNHFETWENYNAEGWPSFYLIDSKGKVVYLSYGAQNYEVIENNIRFLLPKH